MFAEVVSFIDALQPAAYSQRDRPEVIHFCSCIQHNQVRDSRCSYTLVTGGWGACMERESWQVEVARLNVFKWVHCRPVTEHSQQRNFDICSSKVFDSTDTEPLHTDHPYPPLANE